MRKSLAIIGYLLSVGFNIPHLVGAYFIAESPIINTYFIWVSMLVIDFGILVLAINGKTYEAGIFSFIILILNLVYYWIGLPFPDSYGDWVSCLPGLCFSVIPARFVFFFSELISDLFQDSFKTDSEELEKLRPELDNVRRELDEARPALDSIRLYKGENITIGSTKATIHSCGRLVKAGSNRTESEKCICGELIEW